MLLMDEQRGLSEHDLKEALRSEFGIDAISVVSPEAGQDVDAQRYRIDARYFVKVRPAADARETSAILARHLCDEGIPYVVAPLRSRTDALTVRAGEHSLNVYPLVDGLNAMATDLTERQWRALGSFLRELHAVSLPAELAERVPSETYRRAELDLLPRIDEAASRRAADELGSFWLVRRDEIFALAAHTEALGHELEQLALPHVLCHCDLHTNNVMVDRHDELWVIDWDEPTQAPKERDLMFVVGGIQTSFVAPRETACFLEGYGDATTNALALAYYRHAWAVQDIAGYGKQVFLDSSRGNAADRLKSLFGPGSIVEIARGSA
jgi:spectinomycin phosphotransferase